MEATSRESLRPHPFQQDLDFDGSLMVYPDRLNLAAKGGTRRTITTREPACLSLEKTGPATVWLLERPFLELRRKRTFGLIRVTPLQVNMEHKKPIFEEYVPFRQSLWGSTSSYSGVCCFC